MRKHPLCLSIALALVFSAAARATPPQTANAGELEEGKELFVEKCGFCHGPDATGGESGPDLTRSALVAGDSAGDRIAPLVREGRAAAGMPAFTVSEHEMTALVSFIHNQKTMLEKRGDRRGVENEDLQTGNADAGKRYFNGAGKCATCHSPTGDLAGLATRLKGLKLEEKMLNPGSGSAKVTVTTKNGATFSGRLTYRDEFTIALTDAAGWYRSWPADAVKFAIEAPAQAHVELLSKYTDEDIHDLMAYLQTLQ